MTEMHFVRRLSRGAPGKRKYHDQACQDKQHLGFFILLHPPSPSTKLGSVLVLLFPPLSDLFPFPTTTTS